MDSTNDVKNLALLARIGLSAEEEAVFARELPAVLDFFNELAAADTASVSKTAATESISGRNDELAPAERDVRSRIVDNFPRRAGDALSVHSVLSTES